MNRSLKILHCLRAPVGGLFRHVRDLAAAQAAAGHSVGIICDVATGGALAARQLDELRPRLALGVHRIAMSRQIGLNDLPAYKATKSLALSRDVDVIHGHGAKGGAYGRLAARAMTQHHRCLAAFYTPHGGSLHYQPGTLAGTVFLDLERQLEPFTSGLIFESAHAAAAYAHKVRAPSCAVRVIHNGLHPHEFDPVAPGEEAADFVFIGELRRLKGVDVLLRALHLLNQHRQARLIIVGSGPDEAEFRRLQGALGLGELVTFLGARPAREAFALGRCLIVPSRAESFPYIVLEAAAARLPMIATAVGGIPEIATGTGLSLVAPGSEAALANAMDGVLASPDRAGQNAAALQESVAARFTVAGMSRAVLDFYADRLPSQVRLTA